MSIVNTNFNGNLSYKIIFVILLYHRFAVFSSFFASMLKNPLVNRMELLPIYLPN